jgi:hypothetical protein
LLWLTDEENDFHSADKTFLGSTVCRFLLKLANYWGTDYD